MLSGLDLEPRPLRLQALRARCTICRQLASVCRSVRRPGRSRSRKPPSAGTRRVLPVPARSSIERKARETWPAMSAPRSGVGDSSTSAVRAAMGRCRPRVRSGPGADGRCRAGWWRSPARPRHHGWRSGRPDASAARRPGPRPRRRCGCPAACRPARTGGSGRFRRRIRSSCRPGRAVRGDVTVRPGPPRWPKISTPPATHRQPVTSKPASSDRSPLPVSIRQEDLIQTVADALQYISLLPPGRLHPATSPPPTSARSRRRRRTRSRRS